MEAELGYHCETVSIWNNGVQVVNDLGGQMIVLQPFIKYKFGTAFSIRDQAATDNSDALRLGELRPLDTFCTLRCLPTSDSIQIILGGKMTEKNASFAGKFTSVTSSIRLKFNASNGNRFLKNVELLVEEKRMPPMETGEAGGGRGPAEAQPERE